jgi:hypothetical protein
MPDHEWIGTMLRFQKPDGDWGELVNLKGKDGARGPRGPGGGGGAGDGGGFDPSGLSPAADAPTPDEVIVYQSGQWVRASWAQFAGWIGSPALETFRLMTEGGEPIMAEYGAYLRTE